MNIYLVVEGLKTEAQVYPKWITYLNPDLTIVNRANKVTDNNVFIIAGMGYPGYLDRIRDAVKDVGSMANFDRLVVAVDSEDMTHSNKRSEIQDIINAENPLIDHKIIIQHFCIETWALGNKSVFPLNKFDSTFREYVALFDVSNTDPELMPAYPEIKRNRAQFAFKYLNKMLSLKGHGMCYTKSNTKTIEHPKYFEQIKKRCEEGDIPSFNDFLKAFV